MSWSISTPGTPEEVVTELDRVAGTYSGQSKLEFDEALPHLKGLVNQNFRNDDGTVRKLQLTANGSGSSQGGKQLNRECSVTLKALSILLVISILSLLCDSASAQLLRRRACLNGACANDPVTVSQIQKHEVQVQKQVIQAPVQKQVQAARWGLRIRDREVLRVRTWRPARPLATWGWRW